ncbi:Cna B-type domain-containing protein [Lactococcus petauri]|uniref:Cna B-type domain-containing protein n=1 Tax=Lactococcus petauri TaxID=1940789 RepID=UPI003853E5AE
MPGYTTEIKGFDITNHYTPGKTSVTVTKHWDDNHNQDGLRPESIKVQLYADGKAVGSEVMLNDANSWITTWSDLSKKADGKEIVYTVKEITKVNGYKTTIDDNNKGNIIIINKHNITPKPDDNKPNHKEDTSKTAPSSSTHDTLPETGENERMTLMSVGIGLILLMVALITSIFRFKRFKNNK